MTLIVHVPGSATPLTFDDTVTSIPIGRDPDACRTGVLIPEEHAEVGRVHCTIDHVAGYYRLALNKHHAVLVNGKLASDGQELGEQVDLQLGPKGPKLVAVTQLSGKVKPTSSRFEQKGQATHLRESEMTARRGRRLAAIAIVLLFVAGMIGLSLHGKSTLELEHQKDQIAAVAAQSEGLRKLEDTMKTLAPSVYLMGVKDPRGGFS
ncbi:MAG TPA: FHA domain-containing protein, partial [Pirellulales bacterium]|nr:FHA domain-containing protein [Pirellulales bacterium]